VADNFVTDAGSGGKTYVSAQGSWSGDTADLPGLFQIIASGSEGSWTFNVLVGGAGDVTAGTQRVTLANDDVAVALLTTIDADTSSIEGCVDGTELQVDVVSSALPTGAATEATLAQLDGKVTACNTGSIAGTVTANAGTNLNTSALALEAGGNLAAAATSLGNLDNAVDGNYLNVNVNLAGTDAQAGEGVITANTLRVSLATDDDGVASLASIDGKITACNTGAVVIDSGTITTVSTVTAVTSITNAVTVQATNLDIRDLTSASDSVAAVCTNAGTFATQVTSISAGDNNIGNVDIVTLPAANLGQQAMAASLSVVPANNITDATYIGDIKFGEALPEGTNAIGKLAANSGVDIGDVDVTSIAAGTNTIGGVISQASSSIAYDGTTACTVKRFHVANPSDGDSLIGAVADKKFRVLSFGIVSISGTICRYWLDDADGTAVFGNSTGFPLEEDGAAGPAGFVLNHNPGGWFQTATANKALRIQFASGSGVVAFGTYIEVA
jgi:hypothetical protein